DLAAKGLQDDVLHEIGKEGQQQEGGEPARLRAARDDPEGGAQTGGGRDGRRAAGGALLLAQQRGQRQQQRKGRAGEGEGQEGAVGVAAEDHAGADTGGDDAHHQHGPHDAGGGPALGLGGQVGDERQIGGAGNKSG